MFDTICFVFKMMFVNGIQFIFLHILHFEMYVSRFVLVCLDRCQSVLYLAQNKIEIVCMIWCLFKNVKYRYIQYA